jgi:redox-sensitive bicupin YhaK (pirin superfamily)
MATTTTTTLKKILGIKPAPGKHMVGDGFAVRSMFSYDSAADLSPFLLLDYMAPTRFSPSTGEPRGVGEHPHRGFETVSIAYQGEIEHRDSTGSQGRIGPGDVQWMTAGSGIVHEEKHGRDFTRKGGTLQFAQLWVNLPARFKMTPPKYQDLRAEAIPTVALPGGAGTVRVIAGDFQGAKGPASTFTPVSVWDLTLEAGQRVELAVREGHTTALLVLRGDVLLNGSSPAGEEELAVLDRQGDGLAIESRKGARVLLLAGEPIDEPVVGYGPFVMNTEREIRQAVLDFQSGKMGRLPD